ncbi:hypothetical protein J7J56_02650 [candidate division WOR-3 bacterium]|nr:hypothetical protein [candidate division WOR-3 bacterium]
MRISFFEEFPTLENLTKLDMLGYQTTVYVAAYSYTEFEHIQEFIKPHDTVYWIVLRKFEGYWISPLASHCALRRALDEIWDKDIKVMLDLEPPLVAPWRYVVGWKDFTRNKAMIQRFIDEARPQVILCEKPAVDEQLRALGLSYVGEVECIKMVYTSIMLRKQYRETLLRKVCETGVEKYGVRFKIGLGCIAKGVTKLERLLSPEALYHDLKIVSECGVDEAVIYRLGGLNEAYLDVINEFI